MNLLAIFSLVLMSSRSECCRNRSSCCAKAVCDRIVSVAHRLLKDINTTVVTVNSDAFHTRQCGPPYSTSTTRQTTVFNMASSEFVRVAHKK
jgi:hypothetical protein